MLYVDGGRAINYFKKKSTDINLYSMNDLTRYAL